LAVLLQVEINLQAEQGGGILLGGLEGNFIASSWGNAWDIDGVSNIQISWVLWAVNIRREGAQVSRLVNQSQPSQSNLQVIVSRRNQLGEMSMSLDSNILSSHRWPGRDIQSCWGEVTSSTASERNGGENSVGAVRQRLDGDSERSGGRGSQFNIHGHAESMSRVLSIGTDLDGVSSTWGKGGDAEGLFQSDGSSLGGALKTGEQGADVSGGGEQLDSIAQNLQSVVSSVKVLLEVSRSGELNAASQLDWVWGDINSLDINKSINARLVWDDSSQSSSQAQYSQQSKSSHV
jgi:hypothetical protein